MNFKKTVFYLILILMLGTLSSCESDADRARREIDEANQAYEEAKEELDYLKAKKDLVEATIDYYE